MADEKRLTPIFILYVSDQRRSALFYKSVLQAEPILDAEGMTEFALPGGSSLGLMPEKGAERLLGQGITPPSTGSGIPRCEIYLFVHDPQKFLDRVVISGGRQISELQLRPWGDAVCYGADADGHILAFANRARVE